MSDILTKMMILKMMIPTGKSKKAQSAATTIEERWIGVHRWDIRIRRELREKPRKVLLFRVSCAKNLLGSNDNKLDCCVISISS